MMYSTNMKIKNIYKNNESDNNCILRNINWIIRNNFDEIEINTGYNILDEHQNIIEFIEYDNKKKLIEKYGDYALNRLDSVYKPLNENDKNKIIIPKNKINKNRFIKVPVHRFSKNYEKILLDKEEYCAIDIINIIYHFYNSKELTLNDLQRLNDDDVFDYVKKAKQLKTTNTSKKIYYINVMGDCVYFEGLRSYEYPNSIEYDLLLGS